MEWTWAAACRLASEAGNPTRAAALLLEAAQAGDPADPIHDRVIANSIAEIDWSGVEIRATDSWRQWRSSSPETMPLTAAVVDERLGLTATLPKRPMLTLMDVAGRLNAVIRGEALTRDVTNYGVL
jgi:hypothetical protein